MCVRVCVRARARAEVFFTFVFLVFWGVSLLCKGLCIPSWRKSTEYIIPVIKLFTEGEDLRCPGGYINLLITAICYHVTVRLYKK